MIVRVTFVLAVAIAAVPASAQQAVPRPGTARPAVTQPVPAPVPEPPPPAYEPDMLKLAEVMGSLAFLRQLCSGLEAQQWRTRMTELLETEGVTPGRKERLAGAYNRGFKSFALTYRACTPAAEEASARLSKDGERLSRSLAGRFGG
ncbi:MAG: TIGR02301 family protein [Bosea sp. (in: a-proteobacteria)]